MPRALEQRSAQASAAMKTSTALALLLRLALSTVAARERPVDATDHRRYASGEVIDSILEAKMAA
jgi:hypothetical protein